MDLRAGLKHCSDKGISVFASSLDPKWIEESLEKSPKATVRKRKFPGHQVVWLVIGMGLLADRSIKHVVEHLKLVVNGVIASSSITAARYKMGSEPMKWLFERLASAWNRLGEEKWRGLSLYGLDGSHMRVADSDANFEHFGKPKGRTDGGYPQLRLVALMNLSTRLLAGASVAPWSTGEVTLARDLWKVVPDDSLTIIDRGFLSFMIMFSILTDGTNRHVLIRAKKNTKYKIIQVLPDGSALASLVPHSALRKAYADLPKRITVRVIGYKHPGGQPGILITSLLDPSTHPARDIIKLYHERWELEIAFDEIKTHMLHRKEALRSKKPEGVYQEFWGIMVTYTLVRREMLLVAEKVGVPANRVSFTSALLLIQNFFLSAQHASPGTLPRDLAQMEGKLGTMLLPKRRSERRYPRWVKIKMSNYRKNPGTRGLAA